MNTIRLSYTLITEYLYEKIKEYKENTNEFMINSPFVDDEKFHLSINKETGLWQDFKSGNKGNFIHLVSLLENIGYKQAEFYIARKILKDPFSILDYRKEANRQSQLKSIETKSLNHYLYSFMQLKEEYRHLDNPVFARAFEELDKRCISVDQHNFYIPFEGRFVHRLIIPFEDRGKLLFFQGRALSTWQKPKYLNPSSEEGITAGNILYPFNKEKPYVVVTEGVFDAISLRILGINATCINGANISEYQQHQLSGRTVILGFDNDIAGHRAVNIAYKNLTSKGVKVKVCTPPNPYKDWNEAYQAKFDIKQYLIANTESHLGWAIKAVF